MFSFLITLLMFAGVFSFLVVIHELGHYSTARLFKVGTTEFSVGFGNVVYSIEDKNNTQWSLRALPFGGYVAILDQANLENTHHHKVNGKTLEQASYFEKIIIFSAGPMANFIAAFILSIGAIFFFGYQASSPNIIDQSNISNLNKNDKILAIDSIPIHSWKEVMINLQGKSTAIMSIERTAENELNKNTILIKANAKQIQEEIQMPFIIKKILNLLNITSNNKQYLKTVNNWDIKPKNIAKEHKTFIQSVYLAGKFLSDSFVDFILMLKLVAYNGVGLLSGPIGIAKSLSSAASMGFETLLWIVIKLSMSLGLFNLLPLPMLDGGQILLASIERMRGKKLSNMFLTIWGYSGLALIGGLMLYISFQDIIKAVF